MKKNNREKIRLSIIKKKQSVYLDQTKS